MTPPYSLPDHLSTNRFLLRRASPDDAHAAFDAYASDPRVTPYLAWRTHRHPDETRAFLVRAAAEWTAGTGFPMVILPRESAREVIGMIHPEVTGDTVVYGYVLSARWWGRGCMTEVLRRLVRHALSHPAVRRVEATCAPENTASARVMENAGLVLEGVLRQHMVRPNLSDQPGDSLVYAATR